MFRREKEETKNAEILRQLDETKSEMKYCRNQINEIVHPILTEYYIYKLKAEEAKHRYFTELLKEKGLKE